MTTSSKWMGRVLGVFGASCVLGCAWAGVFVVACSIERGVALWSLLLLLVALLVCRALRRRLDRALDALAHMYAPIQIASVPLMLAVGLALVGTAGFDYLSLFDIAQQVVSGEDVSAEGQAYYANYPNNHLLLQLMVALFTLVRFIVPAADADTLLAVHVVVNVAVVQLAVLIAHSAARALWGPRRAACVGLSLLAAAPVWLNLSNPYSDTLALLVMSVALCALAGVVRLEARSPKALWRLVVVGLVLAVGFKAKATLAILAVALALVLIVALRPRQALAACLALALSCGLGVWGIGCAVDAARPDALPYGEQERDANTLPYEHWVMMALNEEGEGAYWLPDLELSLSVAGYDERADADRALIAERAREMGLAGLARHILVTKVRTLWQSGLLLRDYEMNLLAGISDERAEGSSLLGTTSRASTAREIAFFAALAYAQAYQLAMLGGIALAAWALVRRRHAVAKSLLSLRADVGAPESRRDALLVTCLVALFGFLTFLTLIWEVKPRYLLHYLPVMVLLASQGYALVAARHRPAPPPPSPEIPPKEDAEVQSAAEGASACSFSRPET